jgi:thiamine-monophosphate kinase
MKSEFEFIENSRHRYSLRKNRRRLRRFAERFKTDLVMTTDLLVEDIDFRRDWTTPNFSVIKRWRFRFRTSLRWARNRFGRCFQSVFPKRSGKRISRKFYDGYFRLARKFDVEIVGGDVSKTPDKIVVDSIAAGEVEKEKPFCVPARAPAI